MYRFVSEIFINLWRYERESSKSSDSQYHQQDGVLLRCVERPPVDSVQDACRGCFFSINYLTCPKSQCSVFGRKDGKNVWFVEVSKE